MTWNEIFDLLAMGGAAMLGGGLMALYLHDVSTPRVTIMVAPPGGGWEDDEDDTRLMNSAATFVSIDFRKDNW